MNRIISVHLDLVNDQWIVTVTKEFAPEHGGGSQQFQVNGSTNIHIAVDRAREMVTLSPGARLEADNPTNNRYPGQKLVALVEDPRMKNDPTVREALENALALLETEGYQSGDIHDDLALAIHRLSTSTLPANKLMEKEL